MGKAARLKQQRQARAPRPPASPTARRREQLARTATTAGIVAIAVVVGGLLLTRHSPPKPPPAAASAADRAAPAALVRAAAKVGFSPNVEPGVGEIEGKPASAAEPATNPDLLAVGTAAPRFSLKTPQGQLVSLAQYRGRAVLLEFFATWCPHCDAEAPHLRTLAASLPAKTTAIVSINADGEDAASIFAFHRYFGLHYPALVDPSSQPGSFHQRGAPGQVTTAYHVDSFPTFYVLDPKGRIRWGSDGEQPDALLHQQLQEAARSG